MGLDSRIQGYANSTAFITLKDHKENFQSNTKCRLINPAKSEMGLVSKQILENINNQIRSSTNLNQWRNTAAVINWFKKIPYKNNSKFIKFDIVDFYPSISEVLLVEALKFAKKFAEISDRDMEIIMNSRKSLLFDENGIWCKKGDELFDVTMGAYDGAEVCEVVGLFLLHTLGEKLGNKHVGLYRDDGLAEFPGMSNSEADKTRKEIVKIFKDNGLSITIEINLKCTDFLDITLDLNTGKYYPYRKPNDVPLYIDARSNHPPNIIKQLPKMISRRLYDNSCDQAEFEKAKPVYEQALKASGYKEPIAYEVPKAKPKNRKRKVIWFNPPYSSNVKTNIGKIFMNMLEKHFPEDHKFRKLFNKHTVKLSYSCMPSMSSVIHKHNKSIMNAEKETESRKCNCPRNSTCPLDGNCLQKNLIYKAAVSSGEDTKFYYGLCEPEFKSRLANHKKAFKNRVYMKDTELSKYVWDLKDHNKEFSIKWTLESTAAPCQSGTSRCDLCLTEKLKIAQADPRTLINKRSEIISKCRHRNKFTLKCVK